MPAPQLADQGQREAEGTETGQFHVDGYNFRRGGVPGWGWLLVGTPRGHIKGHPLEGTPRGHL